MINTAPAIPTAHASCDARLHEKPSQDQPVTISGLVVSLTGSDSLRRQAIAAIEAHSELTTGECQQEWLSVVLESPTPKQIHRWLDTLPGVGYVDVVFVSIDSEDSAEQPATQSATPAC